MKNEASWSGKLAKDSEHLDISAFLLVPLFITGTWIELISARLGVRDSIFK